MARRNYGTDYRKHIFGPGQFESITLRTRRRHGEIEAKLEGTFTVYCSEGHEHNVTLDAGACQYAPAYFGNADVYRSAHLGSEPEQEAVAQEIIDGWLECSDIGCDAEEEVSA